MQISKILPDKIYDKMIALSSTLSSREISKKLLEEDNFKISHATISKYLKAERQDRAEVFKAKIAEEVNKSVSQDLIIIQDIIDTFYTEFKATDNLNARIKLAKALTDTIEVKFKNCGSQEPTEAFTWEKYLDENEQEEYLY